jgi:hypothetical protein
MVRDGGEKNKFLLGRDDGHLFVAAEAGRRHPSTQALSVSATIHPKGSRYLERCAPAKHHRSIG